MSAIINLTKYFSIKGIITGIILSLCIIAPFETPADGAEISRKVLVLYNSEDGDTPRNNLVFMNCQTVLNYYGILCDHRDVALRPLPDASAMSGYRGVITAFISQNMKKQTDYIQWLGKQTESGKKIIILGDLGVQESAVPEKEINRIYRYLGLNYRGNFTKSKPMIRYVSKDPLRVEFERRYPILPPGYELFKPVDKDIHVSLSIKRIDIRDSESAVIVTGPNGGFAYAGYILWQDPETFYRQWYLNPFTFFEEALGIKDLPRPDTTTLNGNRIAFSHVDCDGFSSVSRTDGNSLCAEVMRDKVFKKYPFPLTVSVIAGEIDPDVAGNKALVEVARDIYRLPNIEPSSHSYSHPFYWDPVHQSQHEHQYGIKIPGYSHDSKVEIDHSVKYINNNLAPPEKTCRVFQWTGNCLPMESDIALCDALGLLNINGGDTIFDDVNNSYTSVAPIYRSVGKRYQIHSGQANENILTNRWTGPFYAYKGMITTMEKTGHPRRICPINIYYHFFSAERNASLKALQDVYEWVLEQDIAKLYTSEYIEIVQGYLKASFTQVGPSQFIVKNYGKCTTVRFDSKRRIPDLSKCKNVIGYSVEPERLYVSLKPRAKEAIIYLSDTDTPSALPHVYNAQGWITDFTRKANSLTAVYRGFGEGKIQFGGLKPKTSFVISGSATGNKKIESPSDNDGRLTVSGIKTGHLIISWK